jgi:hypothetical protein
VGILFKGMFCVLYLPRTVLVPFGLGFQKASIALHHSISITSEKCYLISSHYCCMTIWGFPGKHHMDFVRSLVMGKEGGREEVGGFGEEG